MKSLKVLLLVLITCTVFSCVEDKKFDSAEWKLWTESEGSPNLRWKMRESLLNDYNLKGYDKQKIIELLGKPNNEMGSEYHYSLGSAESGIDTGTMVIKFENDVVISVDVMRG